MMPDPAPPRAATPLDLSAIEAWAIDEGLRGVSLEELVDGFCRRVVEAGFPARRFNMIIGTLHPRHGARSYIWRPTGLETEAFARRRTDEESEAYHAKPHLLPAPHRRVQACADGSTPASLSGFCCSRSCATPG